MNISFTSFIPVKVFIDEKEIKNDTKIVPKSVERATLTLCDCLSKNEKYKDSLLAQQQRYFFSSKVDDYIVPEKPSKNKTEITPSSVKTLNLEGKRYLVTGKDITRMQEIGHALGKAKKENFQDAENRIGARAETMSYRSFENEISKNAYIHNQIAKQDRISSLKALVNDNSINETLYLYVETNPNAKLERDKYQISLIDFRA